MDKLKRYKVNPASGLENIEYCHAEDAASKIDALEKRCAELEGILIRCISELHGVQRSRLSSMGSIGDTYCPQMSRDRIDSLVSDTADALDG